MNRTVIPTLDLDKARTALFSALFMMEAVADWNTVIWLEHLRSRVNDSVWGVRDQVGAMMP